MSRKMEIRNVEGVADLLHAVVLQSANSRTLEPSPDLQDQVIRLGNAYISRIAEQPDHQGSTVYAAYQWPDTGPAILAFIWAVNTRHPYDSEADAPLFFRAFTETKEPTDKLLTRAQMEEDLVSYAVTTFGGPRAV